MAYPLGLHLLIRPLLTGPGTHPLTAAATLALALATLLRNNRLGTALAAMVLALMLLRLFLAEPSGPWLAALTPFPQALAKLNALGHSVALGELTALSLAASAAALLCYQAFRLTLSQLLAAFSLAVPQVAIVGYALGLNRFHGETSLTTVSMVIPLAMAILLCSAHRGGLRALLSPRVGGRVARLQLLLGFSIPFLTGFLLVNTVQHSPDLSLGILIVTVSQATVVLITVSAILYDQVDLGRRRYQRQLELLATKDALTLTYNRYALERRADQELARFHRHGPPLSALLVDIDHFKVINDTYGHGVGDLVLQRLAALMRSHCRCQDMVARWGGEEFVLLLPDTALEAAAQAAEKLRRLIAETDFSEQGVGLPVHISIGCAQLMANESFSDQLRRADAALYSAKRQGRNQVVCAEPSRPSLRQA
ncbi:GGDEF domain-containing protein [Gallaecimonas kandeliae]|uniref:GGDEF domain-containing protein n=1 Tax=Gallaecimonas kandeliae TaxID=3029055 RepID=UPI002648768B|nr:GGDEF domain-containing protein [Gallaecimonas kandeliae]WKE64908.1 GGDEF domain-containing protein [Gallaecimonas kandeliae]